MSVWKAFFDRKMRFLDEEVRQIVLADDMKVLIVRIEQNEGRLYGWMEW